MILLKNRKLPATEFIRQYVDKERTLFSNNYVLESVLINLLVHEYTVSHLDALRLLKRAVEKLRVNYDIHYDSYHKDYIFGEV